MGLKLSNTISCQTAAALEECPSLLECFSHSFFIGGYLVGPQFSMRKFQRFVARCQADDGEEGESPVAWGFMRCGVGVLYMLFHLVGSGYVSFLLPVSREYLSITSRDVFDAASRIVGTD